MSKKPRKKRSKTHVPRVVRMPALMASVLPELTDEERRDFLLAELMPIQALLAGEGSLENIRAVSHVLKQACVTARNIQCEETEGLEELSLIGMCGLALARALIADGVSRVPEEMLRPAERAIQKMVDLAAQMDRITVAFVMEEALKGDAKLLGYDPRKIAFLDAGHPEHLKCLIGVPGRVFFDEDGGCSFKGCIAHTSEGQAVWREPSGVEHVIKGRTVAVFGNEF